MKKLSLVILTVVTFLSCNKQEPTQFSEEALNDTFISLAGNQVSFQSILNKHKGKTIVIDIWASWCSDCIKNMPKVKKLQAQFPDVEYVFLSLDRSIDSWKHGINKYQVTGDHYYLPNAKDCAFADFVNISWIPRYMVINKAGEIVVFNVIEADDEKLLEAIKN
ncbi:hypothetical protein PW52_16515 [Tamlana sedimentorum]|uniref:Thioredoxin domain-containing protein n=1 Tax=Neotamlana sedimentorum TaxID=1435349 RepID=A0A0D7VXR4_9FLAO|nr:TlpA disulfide reductase family protein [Tamlana sedimentorum]KJD31641.1 hypothetical protein PW52_16515 [Tamlana sedimentorum]